MPGSNPEPSARSTTAAATTVGRSSTVILVGVLVVVVWVASGWVAGFSDAWQSNSSTATTVITLLMVLTLMSTQHRHHAAVHQQLEAMISQLPEQEPHLREAQNRHDEESKVPDEHVTTPAPKAASVTGQPTAIYLNPTEPFAADLDELSLVELQVLHSRVCRQLEHDYRTNPAGPAQVTLERYHDLVVELDHRHHAQAPPQRQGPPQNP